MVRNPPANAEDEGDIGSIPGLRRSPGGRSGNPVQYSCLKNPVDGGAWWAMVHGFAKSCTWLNMHTHTHTHTHTWHCWPFCYKGREPCSWVAVLPHLDSLVLIDSDYWPPLFSCSWSRAQTSSPAETTVALPHGGPRINLLLHSPQGRCHFLLDLLCATHWLSFPWWPGLIKVCFFYWCF